MHFKLTRQFLKVGLICQSTYFKSSVKLLGGEGWRQLISRGGGGGLSQIKLQISKKGKLAFPNLSHNLLKHKTTALCITNVMAC